MSDWPFGNLTPLKYGVVYADPAWQYLMRSSAGHAKSPEAHYDTMTPEQIKALPVDQLAGPDCLLCMWSTWPHLPLAMEVLRAWNFTYVTGGAWIKRTPSRKLCFGTGYVLRSASEPFLIGKINHPKCVSRSERNVIDAPIDGDEIPDLVDAIRREHSRKPAEMRAMLERLRPSSHCVELFAREPWPGHDVWGNETEKFA